MLSSKKVIYTPPATNANRHTPNPGKTLQFQGSLGVSKPQANRCQTARENATPRSAAPIRPVYRRHIAGSCYTPKHKPNTSQTPANPHNTKSRALEQSSARPYRHATFTPRQSSSLNSDGVLRLNSGLLCRLRNLQAQRAVLVRSLNVTLLDVVTNVEAPYPSHHESCHDEQTRSGSHSAAQR